MPTDQELKIVISAIDNASVILKQVATASQETGTQIAQSNQSTGISFSQLATTVIGVGSAYQAFQYSVSAVKDFLEDSVQASMDSSDALVQLKVDVDNSGLSYDTYAGQIQAAAQQNIALGFTLNDSRDSIGRLVLATGDYNDALKLNSLAMDLSASKGIGLNQATTVLQQVMAGNVRVLKQYGIVLDDTATSADALNTLEGKVGGSAEAAAGTSGGAAREMQAQWQVIEQQVGDELMPIFIDFFNAFEENLPTITAAFASLGNVIVAVYEAIKPPLIFIGDTLNAIGTAMNYVTDANNKQVASWQNVSQATKDLPLSLAGITTGLQGMGNSGSTLSSVSTGITKVSDSTQTAAVDFTGLANRIAAANNQLIKHADAVAKLTVEYDKMKTTGATDLATLADDFSTKMRSINDSIAGTTQSITDLTTSYSTSSTDNVKSVAEAIVASQQKIADIQTQMAQATSATQYESLQTQLTQEQANYASSLNFRNQNAQAIATASARASETDLQRTIDDASAKQASETTAYNQKLSDLQKQLKDQQDEATAETTLYQNKVTSINATLAAGQAYFKQLSAERVSVTTDEVNAEIAQFQQLGTVIGQQKGASISALPTIGLPTLGTSTAATKTSSSSTIVPVTQGAGSTHVTNINFSGTTVGDAGIKQILNQFLTQVNRTTTLKTFGGM